MGYRNFTEVPLVMIEIDSQSARDPVSGVHAFFAFLAVLLTSPLMRCPNNFSFTNNESSFIRLDLGCVGPLVSKKGGLYRSRGTPVSMLHAFSSWQVAKWLEGLGLARLASLFAEHEVVDDALPHLTSDDLKEMGVKAVGTRRLILNNIELLKQGVIGDGQENVSQ